MKCLLTEKEHHNGRSPRCQQDSDSQLEFVRWVKEENFVCVILTMHLTSHKFPQAFNTVSITSASLLYVRRPRALLAYSFYVLIYRLAILWEGQWVRCWSVHLKVHRDFFRRFQSQMSLRFHLFSSAISDDGLGLIFRKKVEISMLRRVISHFFNFQELQALRSLLMSFNQSPKTKPDAAFVCTDSQLLIKLFLRQIK